MILTNSERYTVPYRYLIRLTHTSSRQLSLGHPAAQHRACVFYQDYGHLLSYFCRHDDISLRRPVKIGSSTFYINRTSERKRYKGAAIDMLLQDVRVRNPGSFFAYAGYDRLYRFFSSEEFANLEKTFSFMRMTDVSKCFSSIYSHTLAWAVKDVQHGKENTNAVSFANDFDDLMLFSNYNETNGIPVGAEISRIFAEIILQSVDVALLRRATRNRLQHGKDFVVRRYIDDYSIFANSPDTLDSIQRSLSESLQMFNLHLNEGKTLTIARPLQTRRSQIIAGTTPGLNKFRDSISTVDPTTQAVVPKIIRDARAITRALMSDMKVACANGKAGYEDISPFIIGSISATIEAMISDFTSAPKPIRRDTKRYAKVFDALLHALYYFFTVHATVPTSYQVAKATILSIRFFRQYLADSSDDISEVVRSLVQDVVINPSLASIATTDCVPIELLNIVLASTELPIAYRTNVQDIRDRVLSHETIDYFSIVSLLFYFGNDHGFAKEVEDMLVDRFLDAAQPRKNSHDCHLLLDLISCPHLSETFKNKCLTVLLTSLEISPAKTLSKLLLREIEKYPWFVNWQQIDLLNHLRRKELRAVY